MAEKLITITAEALMNEPLPKTRMVAEGLIPQGLHILGGAPKTGKSWLVLWLCLKISLGEEVWGMKTEKGSVLYLCLEDSHSRIQDRLLDITDDETVTPNLHLATASDTIASGLINQLEDFICEHPDTCFIAIDTLQLVRDYTGDLNAYANDYREVRALKEIADKYGIAIMLVHHLRKQIDSDPINMLSGTTGLTGAVDGVYILKKDSRTRRTAKLIATGRDISDRELTIEFDRTSHVWNFISDDSDDIFSASDSAVLSEVVTFIKSEKEFSGTATELSEKMRTLTPPNTLAKKILKNADALEELGIKVITSRTGKKREISLSHDPQRSDGSDGNDG